MSTVLPSFRIATSQLRTLALSGLLFGCQAEPVGSDDVHYGPPVEQGSVCTDDARRAPEQCTGLDSNCDGFVDRDLVVTDCTRKLLSYIGEVAQAQAQAQTSRQDGHPPIGCPRGGVGLGEAVRNIYSFTGPLPAACNHLIEDDCADPARKNFWVTVIGNVTTTGTTSYQLMWGSHAGQYKHLGACAPEGTDGEGSAIPKLLVPIRDNNQSGGTEACIEYTSGVLSFYLDSPDALMPMPLPLRDITAVRDLRVSSKDILRADAQARHKQLFQVGNLLVDVQRSDGTWHKARITTNLDNEKEPMLKWQQELYCQ